MLLLSRRVATCTGGMRGAKVRAAGGLAIGEGGGFGAEEGFGGRERGAAGVMPFGRVYSRQRGGLRSGGLGQEEAVGQGRCAVLVWMTGHAWRCVCTELEHLSAFLSLLPKCLVCRRSALFCCLQALPEVHVPKLRCFPSLLLPPSPALPSWFASVRRRSPSKRLWTRRSASAQQRATK